MFDKIKVIVAVLFAAAGVAGYYYLADSATIIKLLTLAGGFIAGGVVAWFTEPGREFFAFARESWAETKKVVWPTTKETWQTTLVVFVFVITMAAFLWGTDKTLEYLLYDLILGRKA